MQQTPDFESEKINLPTVVSDNEKTVRNRFWPKLAKVLARVPFAEKAVAAFYCATDPKTPTRPKAILLAALVYFITPIDVIPDFLAIVGFSDDLAVLAAAVALVSEHMTPQHLARAKDKLMEIRNRKT